MRWVRISAAGTAERDLKQMGARPQRVGAEGIEDALALDLLLHADNLHWSADVGKHRKKSV